MVGISLMYGTVFFSSLGNIKGAFAALPDNQKCLSAMLVGERYVPLPRRPSRWAAREAPCCPRHRPHWRKTAEGSPTLISRNSRELKIPTGVAPSLPRNKSTSPQIQSVFKLVTSDSISQN